MITPAPIFICNYLIIIMLSRIYFSTSRVQIYPLIPLTTELIYYYLNFMSKIKITMFKKFWKIVSNQRQNGLVIT